MQFNEKEKVLQLFSESGRENAERYFVTLGSAQDILDSIAAGNPEHAVALYRAAFDRALPITNSMWMDHLLLFRQMQACMMLGVCLRQPPWKSVQAAGGADTPPVPPAAAAAGKITAEAPRRFSRRGASLYANEGVTSLPGTYGYRWPQPR